MPEVRTISMSEFPLKWRFTDPKYRVLPPADLALVRPLEAASAAELAELTSRWPDMPPVAGSGFASVEQTSIDAVGPEEVERVTQWLLQRGVPPESQVFASWDRRDAAMTTWEMIAKYWNVFWYPSSDDLVVFDESLDWVLFLWHEEEAFFARYRSV